MSSSILKSTLHNSVAEGLYNEIQTRSSRYYYFLGKTLAWENEQLPPYPIDSYGYELETRNEIITMKEIKSTDVAFIVNRVDWRSGTVYDMYDDAYSDQLDGINLISGGFGYSEPPTIVITGGGGTGATAVATILEGSIIDITITNYGRNYTSAPTVEIVGGGGENAAAVATICVSVSGKQQIETANFYVMTDEFNVYKCLDNSVNTPSTYKPVGTTVDPVTMPDGYMWKYMYSIPIALRNKFLTDQYMPVVTALRNQFYSNGTIDTVKIQSGGQGYTFGNVNISGDGYRSTDPLFLNGVVVNTAGTGYSSGAIVDIDPPFSSNAWDAGVNVLLGQKVNHDGNIYEVTLPGQLALPAPSHTSGVVLNGTSALQFVGQTAKGLATVDAGAVTAINLIGGVREVNLITGGSGYTTAPSVTFSSGGGTGASATVVMQGTSVSYAVVTSIGDDYTTAPVVTIGTPWTATTAFNIGDQIFQGNRLYTVTVAGTTSSTAPTHTTGSQTNGTATLTYAGVPATATCELRYGYGYSTSPSITILPVSGGYGAAAYMTAVKSEAQIIPIFDNGQVVAVQILDAGIGYTYADVSVSGDGTGAKLEIDLSPGDVNTLQANTELLTVDGRIMAYKVTSGGYGYVAATVTIEGDGTGASAQAVIENGVVKRIHITNYGEGYRWARVTITGNGAGAKARAIISPYGGHGKESINNLYSRSLLFYTNISKDKNQGFDVNNDFRQVGLIKNPRQYATSYRLDSTIGSACFVVTGAINTVNFQQDMLLRLSTTNRRFRIVNLTNESALLQSLDNDTPNVGDVLFNDDAESFTIAGVIYPTADKYSGDILFIDNKQAFTPTDDQTVTIRTVLRF